MYNCKYCGKETAGGKYLVRHENHCYKNPDVIQETFTCIFCGKVCKNNNSLINHERTCKKNPVNAVCVHTCKYCGRDFIRSNYLTTHERSCMFNPEQIPYISWNRGLTKQTDERIAKQAANASRFFQENGGTFLGRKHSQSTKQKMSNIALKNQNEKHFGKRKVFEYAGLKFISSYEVDVAKSLDENNIKWIQPKRFPYKDLNGKLHYYTPDLYLPDYDVYLDPKNDFLIEHENPQFGYKDVDKIKWVEEYNNIKVIVLNKEQLSWSIIKALVEEYK